MTNFVTARAIKPGPGYLKCRPADCPNLSDCAELAASTSCQLALHSRNARAKNQATNDHGKNLYSGSEQISFSRRQSQIHRYNHYFGDTDQHSRQKDYRRELFFTVRKAQKSCGEEQKKTIGRKGIARNSFEKQKDQMSINHQGAKPEGGSSAAATGQTKGRDGDKAQTLCNICWLTVLSPRAGRRKSFQGKAKSLVSLRKTSDRLLAGF